MGEDTPMTYAGVPYEKNQWRASVQNGKIPASKLAPVEAFPVPRDRDLNGPCLAHPEVAAAMGVMLRTAWSKGVRIWPSLSYRPLAFQLEKFAAWKAGTGNLAATPGTSNHGWGVAFDMSWASQAAWQWMHDNIAAYGFSLSVPTEDWHVSYEGTWKGKQDMTEDELAKITATSLYQEGEKLYRQKYGDGMKDPGAAPENFPPAKRDGWASARFAVRLDAAHVKAEHKD